MVTWWLIIMILWGFAFTIRSHHHHSLSHLFSFPIIISFSNTHSSNFSPLNKYPTLVWVFLFECYLSGEVQIGSHFFEISTRLSAGFPPSKHTIVTPLRYPALLYMNFQELLTCSSMLWIYRYIPFSPLLFIVSITLLISFWLLLFKLCYLEATDTFLHFSHQKHLLSNDRNVGNMFRTHQTCSDILGNFLLRQVTSKVLCSA